MNGDLSHIPSTFIPQSIAEGRVSKESVCNQRFENIAFYNEGAK